MKLLLKKHLVQILSFIIGVGGFCYGSAEKASRKHASSHKSKNREEFDFVIVGAGNAGCVLANRLSQNGKYTVCVLEAGRDDARLPELLPNASPANVPQPGDYHWGKYVRGPNPLQIESALLNRGFGAFRFYQREDENGPAPLRSTTYHRHAGWGGCTSHNVTIASRNPPQNWNQWAALGLDKWSFDKVKDFYFLTENRSQVSGLLGGLPFYSPSVPLGHLGSFDPAFYGFNGEVPLLYFNFAPFVPPLNAFLNVIQGIVNTTLSSFGYPNYLVDADWPPGAHLGGLTLNNFTQSDQNPNSTIVPPGKSSPVNINNVYNPYKDGGFQYPPEYARLGLTGLTMTQRASAANTYLYEAENRSNLTIKSNTLATKVIICDNKATGVEYLNGWNIYQTGRNPDSAQAGYGGSVGDAQFNAVAAKKEGIHKVYARKEVILCAGVYNTPQILMLSGIGDKNDLKQVGIKAKRHLPGVGKHLIDNQELFPFWEADPTKAGNPQIYAVLTAKSTTSQPFPNFQIGVGGIINLTLETADPFVQKNWVGLKSLPSFFQSNVRNDFNNILLDPTQANANPVTPPIPPYFQPIMVDPANVLGMIIEQEEHNRTEGYVKLVSKDPTVPPKIVFNYLQDPRDLQDWLDIMNTTVLPMILALQPSGFFKNLLWPAPSDILQPGVTNFTSMSQVDQTRLAAFLKSSVGGHHAGGTCKMGVSSDPLAVVNQKGSVYGIKGLRVCDNSILPISIYWPNGTLYVIAEKIAKAILAAH